MPARFERFTFEQRCRVFESSSWIRIPPADSVDKDWNKDWNKDAASLNLRRNLRRESGSLPLIRSTKIFQVSGFPEVSDCLFGFDPGIFPASAG